MKPTSQKQIIYVAILAFFRSTLPGDQFRSEEIVKAVKRSTGIRYVYSDTVLRYARMLRAKGSINYSVINKKDRIVKVLELGAVHSI